MSSHVDSSRSSQVQILTMHQKEGEKFQPTEIIEVIAKGSAEKCY